MTKKAASWLELKEYIAIAPCGISKFIMLSKTYLRTCCQIPLFCTFLSRTVDLFGQFIKGQSETSSPVYKKKSPEFGKCSTDPDKTRSQAWMKGRSESKENAILCFIQIYSIISVCACPPFQILRPTLSK